MIYNITFKLGDPGGDGHANTSEYHMTTNYPVKDITAAYDNMTKKIGFDFIKEVACDYQDSTLTKKQFDALIATGVSLNPEDYEPRGSWDRGGNFIPTGDFWLDENSYLDIFEQIIKAALPDFEMRYRDLNEKTLCILDGAAYGIAYHGE